MNQDGVHVLGSKFIEDLPNGPKHEMLKLYKEDERIAGREFDPERFDLDDNKAISRAIRRSKGSYRFRHKT